MFYNQYLNYRRLKDKIEQKLKKVLDLQNAAVSVRDIIVYPDLKKTSFGEFWRNTNPYKEDIDMVARLIDHIKLLSEFANLHHQKHYCEKLSNGEYRLKEAHYNNITRLSLNEFSLYGKRPLTLAEYSLIVEAITELAKKSPDNVHLLLSSLSVINENGKNMNISLYVQSGKNPKIDSITKSTVSDIDITYPGAVNYNQQELDSDFTTPEVSPYVASDNANQSITSSNSVLEIETKGGAKFLQAVDVCLDHHNAHSSRLLNTQLENEDIDTSSFLPEQVDHIVTANSINLDDEATISDFSLHVDPRPKVEKRNNTRQEANILNSDEIESLSQYPKTNISSTSKATFVENPPFGSNYHLVAYQERPLGKFKSHIDAKVKALNEQILKKKCDVLILSNQQKIDLKESHAFETANATVYAKSLILVNQLSKKCKPTFFEFLFGTKDYYLKKKAKAMIVDSATTLNNAKDDAEAVITAWTKDLHFKLDMLTDLPNDFITKLKKPVIEMQQLLEQDNQFGVNLK